MMRLTIIIMGLLAGLTSCHNNKDQKKEVTQNPKETTVISDQNKADAVEGYIMTESGLQYKILRDASGPKPGPTSKVKVNYEGKLLDGTIFDSSYERGEPSSFGLNEVIPGWTEGLQLMSVGSMYELIIPAELAYGKRELPGIPANSTLIFKVELLKIL